MITDPQRQAIVDAFSNAMRILVEDRRGLSRESVFNLVTAMLEQRLDEVQTAAMLSAIAQKRETPDEIAGAVDAIMARKPAITLSLPGTLNIGGTGGDRAGTFNISTTAAIVVAACGIPVIKHGNRRVTSASGSSDLMAALGIDTNRSSQEQVIRDTLALCNFAFVSTASYYNFPIVLTELRRRITIRSLFNLAGPLIHPTGVEFQLIGVAQKTLLRPMAEAISRLGGMTAYVVHGAGGLDEVSCLGETKILSVRYGSIEEFNVNPEDFNVRKWGLRSLLGGSPFHNAQICESILAGEQGAHRDATVVVAGTALVLAGKASSFREGAEISSHALDSGLAFQTLNKFRELIYEDAS